jgi:glutaredoxin
MQPNPAGASELSREADVLRSAMGWPLIVLRMVRLVCLFVFLVVMPPALSAAEESKVGSTDLQPTGLIVFVRDGCPHCKAAKEFLARLVIEQPNLPLSYRHVDRDEGSRDALIEASRRAGVWPPGVPTFLYNHQIIVGFDDVDHVGQQLRELVTNVPAAQESIESKVLGTLSASRLGLPLFTLAMGLLDGFNPCAMWVLLFLLSLLVRLQDRRRMALVAGTFVVTSGVVYYAFMAAWLNVFLFVGMSNGLRVGLAVVALVIGIINVKDFFLRGRGPSLSIPEAAKPGLYARVRRILRAEALPASLVAVAGLAVVVNFIELLCTAGLPAIYTAVLTQQQLGVAAHYAYLGLYIIGYIIDDTLMVAAAVFALGSGKLTERGGRVLKLLSGSVMLGLGAVMLLRPNWLI